MVKLEKDLYDLLYSDVKRGKLKGISLGAWHKGMDVSVDGNPSEELCKRAGNFGYDYFGDLFYDESDRHGGDVSIDFFIDKGVLKLSKWLAVEYRMFQEMDEYLDVDLLEKFLEQFFKKKYNKKKGVECSIYDLYFDYCYEKDSINIEGSIYLENLVKTKITKENKRKFERELISFLPKKLNVNDVNISISKSKIKEFSLSLDKLYDSLEKSFKKLVVQYIKKNKKIKINERDVFIDYHYPLGSLSIKYLYMGKLNPLKIFENFKKVFDENIESTLSIKKEGVNISFIIKDSKIIDSDYSLIPSGNNTILEEYLKQVVVNYMLNEYNEEYLNDYDYIDNKFIIRYEIRESLYDFKLTKNDKNRFNKEVKKILKKAGVMKDDYVTLEIEGSEVIDFGYSWGSTEEITVK
jgi:hypothetical protein